MWLIHNVWRFLMSSYIGGDVGASQIKIAFIYFGFGRFRVGSSGPLECFVN